MDLVSACKDKLAYFRIKELKDVLNQLGLPKQGKKQDLVDRILAIVSSDQALKIQGWAKRNSVGKEAVAKIIDDTYRKMQIPGATDLASTAQRGSNINTLKLKEEVEDSFQLDMRVRCPCGNSLPSESMIQCEDPRCRVWQHMNCVLILEKSVDGVPPVPPQFYCEICRITRADPFWVTLGHPLLPVKLTASNVPTDGTNPVMSVDKTFQLTRADRDLLQKAEYDVQAWCILLNDKVTFRMQWPQYADFQVNGVPIRTTNRPGTQLLGANGRDDGPAITTCTREGINKIILSGCDARIFCLGVRIARRRTVKQVLNLIPKEADGELFEDAVARVCRCIGGGNATDNAGSDSDLEVVADTVTVNLRCPMSGSRMKIVGRFKPCAHMGCFDLDTFVELNQRSRKWQCPICLKNYSLENLIIDPYFNRITTMLRGCGEEVTEIDVKPDGSWRVKNDDEHSDDLSQWHFPDSSLCVIPDRDIKPDLETLKQIKQGGSEGHTSLKLKIKKNHNEIWQVSKPENMHSLSSENHFEEKFVNQSHKIMPMTNSTTGSCREGEDPSVNQDGAGQYCFSANNGIELDSVSMNFESAYGATNRKHSAPSTNADIIILTDSEDDNGNLVSPEAIYATGQADAIDIHFSVPTPGLPNSYPEDPGVSTSGGICLFPCNDNEIGMPPWPSMTSGTQGGTGFQLFGAEADVSDAIVDVQHTSNPCPASLNGYALGTKTTECGRLVPYPVCPTSTTVNDGLVENPLAFGGDDPSLQIFLPARPTGSSVQADLRVHADMSNGLRTEDWISLRLGGGGSDHGDSTGRRQQYASKEGRMETLADTASLILSMSDDRSGRAITDKQRFGGPFSHPRQPRSVRPRLYLSIDSDSD